MSVYKALSLLFLFLAATGCSNDIDKKRHEIRFTQVVKAFSSHLYRDYYRYSKRQRLDSKGGQINDWPINHRVDDPHQVLKRKRTGKK